MVVVAGRWLSEPAVAGSSIQRPEAVAAAEPGTGVAEAAEPSTVEMAVVVVVAGIAVVGPWEAGPWCFPAASSS